MEAKTRRNFANARPDALRSTRTMAIFVQVDTGTRHTLRAEHLIGRGTACHLRVPDRSISTIHASLRWMDTAWELHDLDSSNGTYVDGRRLASGERVPIDRGARIDFGRPGVTFELIDDAPPVAYAASTAGQRCEAQARILAIPSLDDCQYTVFEEYGRWLVETRDGERRDVQEGDILATDRDIWKLHLPIIADETWRRDERQLLLHDVMLHFIVSPCGEHITLALTHPGGEIALNTRVHLELLLRLAEARRDDQARAEVISAEQGWIDVTELLGRLGMEADRRNRLCQLVHNARTQLADAGVVGAVDVIQRRNTIATEKTRNGRRPVAQMRLGTDRITIDYH